VRTLEETAADWKKKVIGRKSFLRDLAPWQPADNPGRKFFGPYLE
jgi:hypothetical protein